MAQNIEFLDFYAAWCGPCQAMSSIIEALEKKYAQKIKISKYNVEEDHEIAQKYHVMSIPTYIIVKNGKVINQFIGAQTQQTLEAVIDDALK